MVSCLKLRAARSKEKQNRQTISQPSPNTNDGKQRVRNRKLIALLLPNPHSRASSSLSLTAARPTKPTTRHYSQVVNNGLRSGKQDALKPADMMRLDLRRVLNLGALIRAPDRIQQHLIKRDQRLDIQLIATFGTPLHTPATQHGIAADLDALMASDLGERADDEGAGELGVVDTMRALEAGDKRRVRRAQEGLAEQRVQRADVRHVLRRVPGAAAGPLEWVQRRLHRERRPRRDVRQALDADGAAETRDDG